MAEPSKVTIPIPMEHLRDMAKRLNEILTMLLAALNNTNEKEGLREIQQKLHSLEEIQRAVMGDTLPHSPQFRPTGNVSVDSSVTQVPSFHDEDLLKQ